MGAVVDFNQFLGVDSGVALCRGQRRVPKQFLNGAQVATSS